MKNLKVILLTANILAIAAIAGAQTLNWQNAGAGRNHIINLNAGWDYGLAFGAGYGYQFNVKVPVMLNAAVSLPSGKNIGDDFKTKISLGIRWFQTGGFCLSTDISGIFRRHENGYARLLNFGSSANAVVGYYRPKWFFAGEFGFDKAIVTHFKHSAAMRENYPGVVDGWYEPPTGGNFNYGIQSGFSFKRSEVYLKAGKVIAQDFKTSPLVPFYVQIGVNRKLGGA